MLITREAVLAVVTVILTMEALVDGQEERRHHRRKRPCYRRDLPPSGRTFLTFLIGDLVVHQAGQQPCGTSGGGHFGNHGGLFGGGGGGGPLGSHGGILGGGGGTPGNHGGLLGGLFGGGGGLLGGLLSNNRPPFVASHSDDKPVSEDIEEDEVHEDLYYRPGSEVGAVNSAVSGYTQDLSHLRPDKVVRRINRQFNRYVIDPFVDLFLR